jgi:PAS domain S-box-containing protein
LAALLLIITFSLLGPFLGSTLYASQPSENGKTSPFDSLYNRAVFNMNHNIGEGILIADSLRQIAIRQKDAHMEFYACSLLGEAYFYKRNFERAINWFEQCLSIAVRIRDRKLEARSYNSLGIAYANWDYSKSLEFYGKSLAIKEQLGDSAGMSSVLNNIGTIYDEYIKDYRQALKYYMRSWKIEELGDDPDGIATSMLNVGDVYRKLGELDKSRTLLIQCIQMADSAGLLMISEMACQSLFKLSEESGQWKEALSWHKRFSDLKMNRIQESQQQQVAELEVKYKMEEQSNQIRLLKSEQKISDRERRNQRYAIYLMTVMVIGVIAFSWILYTKSKSIRNANKLLKAQHLEIQKQQEEMMLQSRLLEKSNEELQKLSIVASKTDNMVVVAKADGEIEWVNEGFMRILGIGFDEFKTRYSGNLFEASLNPEIRKMVRHAVSLKQSVNYSSKTINRQGREIWFQTTLTPILNDDGELVRIIAIDTDISKLKITERELAYKQLELTDSIRYAQRIQVSMFPSAEVFSSLFQDHFIIYKPRDIVSGDFYWLLERENSICLAIADCTGHGVPGAFMGVIGITLLNEIFHQPIGTYGTAADVLTELRRMVKLSISAGVDRSEMHDGMDFSLCIIDKVNGNLQFSGAYHSLFVARSDGSPIDELKGDKMPVGDYPTDKEFFTNIDVPVARGDVIYLQSDGFWHQMGGPLGKKFGKKRYAQLLRDIRHLSLADQKHILTETMNQWMEVAEKPLELHPQLDDIMIVSCRI